MATTTTRPLPPSLLEQVVPKLRPFQREALDFATKGAGRSTAGTDSTNNNGQQQPKKKNCCSTKMLLADEMGLGKTVTSLAIMAYYEQEWPLLILCPNTKSYPSKCLSLCSVSGGAQLQYKLYILLSFAPSAAAGGHCDRARTTCERN